MARDEAKRDRHMAVSDGEVLDLGPNAESTQELDDAEENPPRTTTGPLTAPKFGSAGSGGLELEPGPDRP